MKEFTVDYLRCINCNSKLELDVIDKQYEVEEGFLHCQKCESVYPIIQKTPILWKDISIYFSTRRALCGTLINSVSPKLKSFLKKSLTRGPKNIEDRTNLENRWTTIYQSSARSRFYHIIKNKIKQLPNSNLSVEYGCSIGLMSKFLADSSQTVFGIDRSFNAIKIARKNSKENLDYIVADSLSPVFGDARFDLILALNLLELVEPKDFLSFVNSQMRKGHLIITDPYDYDRGKNSVKKPLDEITLRNFLRDLGFRLVQGTDKPSNLTWNLKLNPRTRLNYKVDLIIGKK